MMCPGICSYLCLLCTFWEQPKHAIFDIGGIARRMFKPTEVGEELGPD